MCCESNQLRFQLKSSASTHVSRLQRKVKCCQSMNEEESIDLGCTRRRKLKSVVSECKYWSSAHKHLEASAEFICLSNPFFLFLCDSLKAFFSEVEAKWVKWHAKNDEEATNPNRRLEISGRKRKTFNRIVSIATPTRISSNGNW